MSDKRSAPLLAVGREPRRSRNAPQERLQANLPPRGRHNVGLAKITLSRAIVARGARPAPIREVSRADRRREQMPLPPGFVDRRRAA